MMDRRPRSVTCFIGPEIAILALAALLVAQAAAGRAARGPGPERAEPPEAETQATQPPPSTQPAFEEARMQMTSGLVGSKHDFRKLNEGVRDLCLPCHTPHLVSAPTPLLDQRPMAPPPLRPYRGVAVEMDGWSLLCLGCHDGVTAPDVYSSAHAVEVAGQLGNSRLGTKGLRSHPLGVEYPIADEAYQPLAAVESAGLPLPDGRIQCATCHDAHNTHGYRGMLRVPNDRSRLCLICHQR